MTTDADGGKVRRPRFAAQRVAIVLVLVGWTYLYNLFIKEQGIVGSFFKILDTVSDDFVMGTLVTILVGLGIVVVFSVTKLYTQIIANIHSFRIIEDLVHSDLRQGRYRQFWSKILHFEDQPRPDGVCPRRISSLLFSFSFMYVVSWIYVVLFSEALWFLAWSAGVTLRFEDWDRMLLLPTLSLAVPFSARVMAYVRYPYAQDYADFMPGAVFVLLVVGALGVLFESSDQKYFLAGVWAQRDYLNSFLQNGAYLAFIPVFFEGMFWIYELNKEESRIRETEE